MTTKEVSTGEDPWTALVHLQGFSPRSPGGPALRCDVQYLAEQFAAG